MFILYCKANIKDIQYMKYGFEAEFQLVEYFFITHSRVFMPRPFIKLVGVPLCGRPVKLWMNYDLRRCRAMSRVALKALTIHLRKSDLKSVG